MEDQLERVAPEGERRLELVLAVGRRGAQRHQPVVLVQLHVPARRHAAAEHVNIELGGPLERQVADRAARARHRQRHEREPIGVDLADAELARVQRPEQDRIRIAAAEPAGRERERIGLVALEEHVRVHVEQPAGGEGVVVPAFHPWPVHARGAQREVHERQRHQRPRWMEARIVRRSRASRPREQQLLPATLDAVLDRQPPRRAHHDARRSLIDGELEIEPRGEPGHRDIDVVGMDLDLARPGSQIAHPDASVAGRRVELKRLAPMHDRATGRRVDLGPDLERGAELAERHQRAGGRRVGLEQRVQLVLIEPDAEQHHLVIAALHHLQGGGARGRRQSSVHGVRPCSGSARGRRRSVRGVRGRRSGGDRGRCGVRHRGRGAQNRERRGDPHRAPHGGGSRGARPLSAPAASIRRWRRHSPHRARSPRIERAAIRPGPPDSTPARPRPDAPGWASRPRSP